MRKRVYLQKKQLSFLQKDLYFYICILASFIVGGIIAAVFAFTLPELSCKELLLYLEDFFRNTKQSGADSSALFRAGVVSNLKNFGFLFFFSLTVIGAPFIAGFSAFKGFVHCFTLFFMFRVYGLSAALFFLLGMLPHYLLLVPCYLCLLVLCLKFSLSLIREKQELTKTIPHFLAMLALFFCFSVMATLLQAYIEPLLIRLISGLFL